MLNVNVKCPLTTAARPNKLDHKKYGEAGQV